MKSLLSLLLLVAIPLFAAEPGPVTVTTAINALGIDLLRAGGKPDANALLSPYSIQNAMAMAYAGADGATRKEMARVLHFPDDDAGVHSGFAALQRSLDESMQQSAKTAEQWAKSGRQMDPFVLTVANRLFGQSGFDFRPAFLELLKEH